MIDVDSSDEEHGFINENLTREELINRVVMLESKAIEDGETYYMTIKVY